MNTDNVLLVILLVLGIVLLSNLAMFFMVRRWRDIRFDWFKNIRTDVDRHFGDKNSPLGELRRRVEQLKENDEE
jgi:hypothetical protein